MNGPSSVFEWLSSKVQLKLGESRSLAIVNPTVSSTQDHHSGVRTDSSASDWPSDQRPSITPWKLLYIIEGTITFAFGLIALFVLPNNPATTRIFNEEEREFGEAGVLLAR